MPGKQVKNWKVYHALRRQGYSKESAARIANSKASRIGRSGVKRISGKRGKQRKRRR